MFSYLIEAADLSCRRWNVACPHNTARRLKRNKVYRLPCLIYWPWAGSSSGGSGTAFPYYMIGFGGITSRGAAFEL